jgi:riboflavin kinase
LTLKPALWYTLYKLAELGTYNKFAKVSSTKLAAELSISQQTASKRLIYLEESGYIERKISSRGSLIKIINKGTEELRKVYINLQLLIKGPPIEITFEGRVFSGFGEGAYYVSHRNYKSQFMEKLGFVPYPGTLNLKLSSSMNILRKRELMGYPAIEIEGFKNGKRTYGLVKCFPALISDKVNGAVLLVNRTHYDETVLELVAPVNLRETLKIRDGDKIKVKINLANKH